MLTNSMYSTVKRVPMATTSEGPKFEDVEKRLKRRYNADLPNLEVILTLFGVFSGIYILLSNLHENSMSESNIF